MEIQQKFQDNRQEILEYYQNEIEKTKQEILNKDDKEFDDFTLEDMFIDEEILEIEPMNEEDKENENMQKQVLLEPSKHFVDREITVMETKPQNKEDIFKVKNVGEKYENISYYVQMVSETIKILKNQFPEDIFNVEREKVLNSNVQELPVLIWNRKGKRYDIIFSYTGFYKLEDVVIDSNNLKQIINNGFERSVYFIQEIGNIREIHYNNKEMTNKFFRKTEDVSLLTKILERVPHTSIFRTPLKHFIQVSKENFNEFIDENKLSSENITVETIANFTSNVYDKTNPMETSELTGLLEEINTNEETKKVFEGKQESKIPIKQSNVKKCPILPVFLYYKDEERNIIEQHLTNLGLDIKDRKGVFKKFVQEKVNPKSRIENKTYSFNHKMFQRNEKGENPFGKDPLVMNLEMNKPKKERESFDPVDKIKTTTALRCKENLDKFYDLFDAALDKTKERKYMLSKIIKENVKHNLYAESFWKGKDENWERLQEIVNKTLVNDYFLESCIQRTKLAEANGQIFSGFRNRTQIKHVKVDMEDPEDGNFLTMRHGTMSSDLEKFTSIIAGIVNDETLKILQHPDFTEISFFGMENRKIIKTIKLEENRNLIIFTREFHKDEEFHCVNHISMISILADEDLTPKQELYSKKLILLSNTTNVRKSEEPYFWNRFIITLPYANIVSKKKMFAEIASQWTNEFYSHGLIVELINNIISGRPLPIPVPLYLQLLYPYFSKKPAVFSKSNRNAGLYKTIQPMTENLDNGVKINQLGEIYDRENSHQILYTLLEESLKHCRPGTIDHFETIKNKDLLNLSMDGFHAKGTKFCQLTGNSVNAGIASYNMLEMTQGECSKVIDVANWYCDNYYNNTILNIKKEKYNKMLYLSLFGINLDSPMKQKDIKRNVNKAISILPDSINVDFREYSRVMLSIYGTPKVGERGKAEVRSIFLMPFLLYAAQQFMEELAKVFIETNNPTTTIQVGNFEKMSILQDFMKTLAMDSDVEIDMISDDKTKWHANHSTKVFTKVLLHYLESMKNQLNNLQDIDYVEKIIDMVFWCSHIFDMKRVLVDDWKTVFIGKKEYRVPYINTNEDYTELANTRKLSMLFKHYDEASDNLVHEGGLCKKYMSIPLGNYMGYGFCMGFFNILSTLAHDSSLNYLKQSIERFYQIKTNILHSSDDGIWYLLDLKRNSTKQDYTRRTLDMINFCDMYNKLCVGMCFSWKKFRCTSRGNEKVVEYTSSFYWKGMWKYVLSRDSNFMVTYDGRQKSILDMQTVFATTSTLHGLPYFTIAMSLMVQMEKFNHIYNCYSKESRIIYQRMVDLIGVENEIFVPEFMRCKYMPIGRLSSYNESIIKTILADKTGNKSLINLMYQATKERIQYSTCEADMSYKNMFDKYYSNLDFPSFFNVKVRMSRKQIDLLDDNDLSTLDKYKSIVMQLDPRSGIMKK